MKRAHVRLSFPPLIVVIIKSQQHNAIADWKAGLIGDQPPKIILINVLMVRDASGIHVELELRELDGMKQALHVGVYPGPAVAIPSPE